MNLSENFQQAVETLARPVAATAAAIGLSVSLSGCLGTLPVQRVVTDSVVRGTLPARQELYRQGMGAVRLHNCPTEATYNNQQDNSITGALGRVFTPTRVPTVGECPPVQQPSANGNMLRQQGVVVPRSPY